MIRRTPASTPPYSLFPYLPLFRTEIGVLPLCALRLSLVEVGGDCGAAVAILGDARFAGRGGGFLARHLGALAGGQQLVDEDGERDARPDEQHRPRDQRAALLPDGAHAQETDVAVPAEEDFMVLTTRLEPDRKTVVQGKVGEVPAIQGG